MWQVLAQFDDRGTANTAGGIASFFGFFCCCFFLVVVPIIVFTMVGMWKVYAKAGKPGWAAFVPIYNVIVLLEIAGRPAWWIVLYFLPFVNIVAAILVSLDIARKFRQSQAFGIGLALLPAVFFMILGYGKAQYDPSA